MHVLQCDLSKLSNVVHLAREFRRQSNRLDVLVCNAGVFHPGPFALVSLQIPLCPLHLAPHAQWRAHSRFAHLSLCGPQTEDGIEQTLAVNYYAHALLTLELLGELRATPNARARARRSAPAPACQGPAAGLPGLVCSRPLGVRVRRSRLHHADESGDAWVRVRAGDHDGVGRRVLRPPGLGQPPVSTSGACRASSHLALACKHMPPPRPWASGREGLSCLAP